MSECWVVRQGDCTWDLTGDVVSPPLPDWQAAGKVMRARIEAHNADAARRDDAGGVYCVWAGEPYYATTARGAWMLAERVPILTPLSPRH
jgi:hypothetical protein